MRIMLGLLSVVVLAALAFTIRFDRADAEPEPEVAPRPAEAAAPVAASARQPAVVAQPTLPPDPPRPIMQAQVVLERLGFSSGIVDGKEGQSFAAAVRGFQMSRGLAETGRLDAATGEALAPWSAIPATRVITIPADFAQGPFHPGLPTEPGEQAKVSSLGYRDLAEKLAERFHTNVATLIALNSAQSPVGAGRAIRVPNVGNDVIEPGKVKDRAWLATLDSLGVGTSQPAAARIEVDKSEGVLKVFDDRDQLVAQFPATMGSEHDPLPLGRWTLRGASYNPPFHYNPDLFWDAAATDDKALLPPGPNGPVGVVWIDLSKPHYGIHGTPEPDKIGRTQSHGCIRLTNWDAARLALMVKPGTPAHFVA